MACIASVALEQVAYHFDKAYSYVVPDRLAETAKAGCRVLVPFGKGNRKRQGIITAVSQGEAQGKKPILALLDDTPLLDASQLQLAAWMKSRTFCTQFEAVKAMLPAGVCMKLKTYYAINPDKQGAEPDGDAGQLLAVLRDSGGFLEQAKLLDLLAMEPDSDLPEQLVRKGYLLKDHDAVRVAGDATERLVRLSIEPETLESELPNLTKKQKTVAALLLEAGSASVKEVCYFAGVTPAVVKNLVKKGIAEFTEHEVYRNPYAGVQSGTRDEIILTETQKAAYEKILNASRAGENGAAALLYGVTGSGKTQVYLKLIDTALDAGQNIIVMVPEIALTPQVLSIFHARYGGEVAVFHSRLSVGQRMDEWKRVKNGKARIVVGTRSAIFAPFPKIGLIIMDEEQEHTYKSEQSPRYHARDIARYRCAQDGALLVLASATPSLESYTAAKQGRYVLAELSERYGAATLPNVVVADMRFHDPKLNGSSLSKELRQAVVETYEAGQQSILLMNRRGFHTFAACNSCGHVITCPHCSVSLTYHSANARLMCHYCGYSAQMDVECPECHEKNIRFSGTGTQKIEEELKQLVPEANIVRMDMDTTMSRYAHESILQEFAEGRHQILLGTQMVAKGLDFPNVTLVGVINADQSLYFYDYRSMETTFALLTQVVGRSGRGETAGKAVIQTITPENPVIQFAAAQDYEAFYNEEIGMRKLMVYPPFCDLCAVGFVSSNEENAKSCATFFFERIKYLNETVFQEQKLIILGPTPARVAKANKRFRYRLYMKCKNSAEFRRMVGTAFSETARNGEFKQTTVFVDINPKEFI